MAHSSSARCTQIRPNGRPCKARALPAGPYCVFHDPALADKVAAGRRKGGATSRRPGPRQLAALLGELLVQALEQPDPANTTRLQTINTLARATLSPTGTPAEQERLRKRKRHLKRHGTGR
jgi:hypothetical protein